jgi:hypothetical protein
VFLVRLIAGAAVVSLVNLMSVGLGFWVYRLLGSREQIAVQVPVALVTGMLGVAWWLRGGVRLHGLAPGRDYLTVYLLAFAVGAAVFYGAHFATTGYPTSLGNIVGVWAIQIAENSLAMPVAAAWLRKA